MGQFDVAKEDCKGVEAAYGFDERALTKNACEAQFWVARRPGG